MFTSVSRVRSLGLFAVLAASLVALALDVGSLGAQPPGRKGKGPKGPPPGADILTVRGTVRDFTIAPKGEVDGVTLTDGTWVHWPPHLADHFSSIVGKGDRIKVIGWMETGKKGDYKLEVSSLANLNTNQTRENDRFPPAAVEGRAGLSSSVGEAVTANGSVKEFTTAPKGEVDGFILSDGLWVHWPILGWALMSLRLALIALATSAEQIIAIQVLDGLAQSFFAVAAAAWVTDRLADPRRVGEAQVLVGSSLVFGSAVGPLLSGLIVGHIGFVGMFGLLAGVGTIALILVIAFVPETIVRPASTEFVLESPEIVQEEMLP